MLPEVPSPPMARLWTKRLWRTVRVPELKMPPPKASTTATRFASGTPTATLSDTTAWERVRVPAVQDAAARANGLDRG